MLRCEKLIKIVMDCTSYHDINFNTVYTYQLEFWIATLHSMTLPSTSDVRLICISFTVASSVICSKYIYLCILTEWMHTRLSNPLEACFSQGNPDPTAASSDLSDADNSTTRRRNFHSKGSGASAALVVGE